MIKKATSSMIEFRNAMKKTVGRCIEIYQDGVLRCGGGMYDFICDNGMEDTKEGYNLINLKLNKTLDVSTGQGWVQVKRVEELS